MNSHGYNYYKFTYNNHDYYYSTADGKTYSNAPEFPEKANYSIDWSKAAVKSGENNEDTVVAPLNIKVTDPVGKFKPKAGWNLARIGAQVILTAMDSKGKKYVLFVFKPRSATFMELPGGGFGKNPGGNNAFESLIKEKLDFKCDIGSDIITNLKDTGKALLLNEKGVAKNTAEITWPWSYYRLFTAELKYPLDSEELHKLGYDDLGYNYDNSYKANGRNSYRAFMRWVPVDELGSNTAILNRYSTLLRAGFIK
jgi:hypothetical protein